MYECYLFVVYYLWFVVFTYSLTELISWRFRLIQSTSHNISLLNCKERDHLNSKTAQVNCALSCISVRRLLLTWRRASGHKNLSLFPASQIKDTTSICKSLRYLEVEGVERSCGVCWCCLDTPSIVTAVTCAALQCEHVALGTMLPGRGWHLPGDTLLLSRLRLCLRLNRALEMVRECSVVRWIIIILLFQDYVWSRVTGLLGLNG